MVGKSHEASIGTHDHCRSKETTREYEPKIVFGHQVRQIHVR